MRQVFVQLFFRLEIPFEFVFALTGAIATVICATLAGFVATGKKSCFGTFRDHRKLTSYGFDKIGDDFVMFWVIMKMIIN